MKNKEQSSLIAKKVVRIRLDSSEYKIAKTQLDYLNQISEQRMLTLDEIKAYDLLVKNLKVATDLAPEEEVQELPEISNDFEELMRIAVGAFAQKEIPEKIEEFIPRVKPKAADGKPKKSTTNKE